MKIELKINDKTFKLSWLNNFLYTLLGLVIIASVVILSAAAISGGLGIEDMPILQVLLAFWISALACILAWKWWDL